MSSNPVVLKYVFLKNVCIDFFKKNMRKTHSYTHDLQVGFSCLNSRKMTWNVELVEKSSKSNNFFIKFSMNKHF
jgi:hypothetical protein